MAFRLFVLLFAGVLLSSAHARAQDNDKLVPLDDPLGLKKLAPPPPAKGHTPAATPRAATPSAVAAGVRKDVPRTDKPLEDATDSYERKEYVVDNGKDPKHTLTYFWEQPKGAAQGPKLYPLVIVLGDAKGIAEAGEFLVKRDLRKEFPAFIVAPVIPNNTIWSFPESFPDDPSLAYMAHQHQALPDVVDMIPDLLQDYPIDRRRIYVIGCADGGFGAYGAAKSFPDVFAAAVPINGGWAIKESPEMTKIPLFIMHGEDDTVVQPRLSRDVAYYIQMYGGVVYYIKVPNLGHDCKDPRLYSRAMWYWLFSQKKRKV